MIALGPPPGTDKAEAPTAAVVVKNAGPFVPGAIPVDQLRPSDQLVLWFGRSAPIQLFATKGLVVRTSWTSVPYEFVRRKPA